MLESTHETLHITGADLWDREDTLKSEPALHSWSFADVCVLRGGGRGIYLTLCICVLLEWFWTTVFICRDHHIWSTELLLTRAGGSCMEKFGHVAN